MGYISIFQQSIHHANILAAFGYPPITLFLYSPICIDITSNVFEMSHLFDFNVMYGPNVILTCDGVRLMTITSVFIRLSLS